MRKLILVLIFIPLVSLGQKNTKFRMVSETETETITWGEKQTGGSYYGTKTSTGYIKRPVFNSRLAVYTFDRNPFNDNEKSLKILIDKSYLNHQYATYFIISKSDVKSEKLNIIFGYAQITSYEFIFDNDKSTYFKLDSDSAKEIKSLDHELFLKFKKHKKVIVRRTNRSYGINDAVDYVIGLNGFTEAYKKYMEIKAPTMKNKSLYKVVNGLANVNPFNLDKYIDKFISDAKTNHNIDLSYVNKKDRLILFKELEGDKIASAYNMNEDDSVLVLVDPENWYDANQPKRWYIIYHELGHDILNLDHGECGPMMNERASGNYSWNRLEKDKNTMFEMYKSK